MMHPLAFFSLGMNMARLGLDAQVVIAERVNRLARGDLAAGVEATRMVTEKALAMAEVNARLAKAAAAGTLDKVGPDIVKFYGRKVRANRRRLGK
ncbi:hypothetical protein J2X65_003693 [Ancylobacter sp. 3268]|uniref:hypothetical protein n=1 Tax=Ancylobacter sp. 3268 TaxID=2817752 RepID=UPI002862AE65|nr:hypothetical protein [Ancylobacter sp. 3268]MDR6954323.1 hypothetical protein [Ancylobacter sp. 3268]